MPKDYENSRVVFSQNYVGMNVLSDNRRLQVDPSTVEEPLGLDRILLDGVSGPDYWTGLLDHTKTTISLQNPALQATFSQSQR